MGICTGENESTCKLPDICVATIFRFIQLGVFLVDFNSVRLCGAAKNVGVVIKWPFRPSPYKYVTL